MEISDSTCPSGKNERYDSLCRQLESLLADEHDVVSNMANASALLGGALPDINWVGFYRMVKGALLLGPFQGKVACIHIPVGKGVCGTAVRENVTQVVGDVHAFPGHIACDSASRSEIVVPLHQDGGVVAVLDIDSPLPGRFDGDDARWLERAAVIIERACDWNQQI